MRLLICWALTSLALFTMGFQAFAGDRDYLEWAGVSEAHTITKGRGVTIAQLNTGVNYYLPEFQDRIAKDQLGRYGFDAVTGSYEPMDLYEYGLGTQVASMVAGNLYGIAPEARLIPVRVFDEFGGGQYTSLVAGVNYGIERGANIIEIGGGPLALEKSPALCAAMKRAEANGILLVLPVGNDGSEVKEYPRGCSLSNILVVAALDPSGELTRYSSFGFPAVHIAAPAENIWRVSRDGSTLKDGRGTSFAAAFATGTAALVMAAHPNYTVQDVKVAMVRGAVEKNSLRGKVLSNGYLNAAAAIAADVSRPE
jgi:subtilisin family serine protease